MTLGAGGLSQGALGDEVAERHIMIPRRQLTSETVTPAIDMPTGKTQTAIVIEVDAADLVDGGKTLDVRLEYSTNGGTNWFIWCGFTTNGLAVGAKGRRAPSMYASNAPPSGAILRVREIPNGGAGINAGVAVEFT